MNVWLISDGEPLPTDEGVDRAWRSGLLAEQLLNRGHHVVWWSSAFDHVRRRQRRFRNTPINVSASLRVWHLDGTPYRRSISLARLRNHRQVANNFGRFAPGETPPDVILSSLPTSELCCAAVDYGDKYQVPVALDVLDLWPDVALELTPFALRGAARRALWWMTRELRYATRRASAILGLTDEFVQWGLNCAQRPATALDRAFPMAYPARIPDAAELERADDLWDAKGLRLEAGRFIVCFFGTIGWMFDFDTVVAAAKRLRFIAPHVTFVICGSGDRLEALRQQVTGLSNVILPGRIGHAEIYSLMRRSSAGLAPYRPFRNFQDNLANKPIEYLSAALPILASELKVLGHLIDRYGCGISYKHGDDEALTDAVLQLVRNPASQATMARRAEALYRQRFIAEHVYDAMAAHLEMVATSSDSRITKTRTGHESASAGRRITPSSGS